MTNSYELWNAFERYYVSNDRRYPWQQYKNSNNPTQMININSANWMESIYYADELKNSF
ncbi:MAG: hypothetical protein Q8P53_04020 [Candidatus Shapirobacteria bacterium]|nr:hypothetical protein [Candidatus Shapirobacteria bacterium]